MRDWPIVTFGILAIWVGEVLYFGTPTFIRVRNDSDTKLENVIVGATNYGEVPARATSPYRLWWKAYRYSNVSLTANARDLTMEPIDYVGEEHLPLGRFTYVLSPGREMVALRLED